MQRKTQQNFIKGPSTFQGVTKNIYGLSSTSYHSGTKSHILKHSSLDDHKDMVTASSKTLPVKPCEAKRGQRKKECSIYILTFYPFCTYDYDFFNSSIGRSLNLFISISYLNLFIVVEGIAFVNRSARLLHDRIS